MIRFSEDIQVYVSLAPIDFRKGINGLMTLVVEVFQKNPQAKHLFLFRDRTGRKLKAIYWDKNGFMLLYKRIEKIRFCFPKLKQGELILDRLQLECLLSGMEFIRKKSEENQNYSAYI